MAGDLKVYLYEGFFFVLFVFGCVVLLLICVFCVLSPINKKKQEREKNSSNRETKYGCWFFEIFVRRIYLLNEGVNIYRFYANFHLSIHIRYTWSERTTIHESAIIINEKKVIKKCLRTGITANIFRKKTYQISYSKCLKKKTGFSSFPFFLFFIFVIQIFRFRGTRVEILYYAEARLIFAKIYISFFAKRKIAPPLSSIYF